MSIEEADRAARRATDSIATTARCSVFAKSEMTHFGNHGRPADALFNGYFTSVAKYVAALLARARVDGPIYTIGGCARIESLLAGLSEATGVEVTRLADGPHLEAIGAASLAAEQVLQSGPAALPDDPDSLISPKENRFRCLDAPRDFADRVQRLEADPVTPGAERQPSVLGLDLGSKGSKAVLTSLETGEATLDLYDRTRGNPVEACRRLVATLLEETTLDVRAIALTGSGREAAATVVRAAFGDLADRVVVQNEIVAHATAAIRCDPEGGRSLSVVEIGGQDAKFIQIVGGRIVESDMNKACSAGTGSFLEEQAVFFDIAELGQMCTVHVAEAAGEAANEGFGIEDLFGGFQRLDRAMSDQLVRRFNERGVHVIVEPMNLLHEYLAAERVPDLFGYPSAYVPNELVRREMKRLREEFYGEVGAQHPWLTTSEVGPMLRVSEEILERRPHGEARIGIGSALYAWDEGQLDGIVAVGPWGCENSLLTEGLLTHKTDIPILFVYLDGSPIDERRIDAFSFRLQAEPPRSRQVPVGAAAVTSSP